MSSRSPSIYANQPSSSNPSTATTTTTAEQLILNLTQSLVAAAAEPMLDDEFSSTNSLDRYRILYRNYHGITSSFVCIFGLTCNLFNIIVLTRPLMRSSTNTILTSLAVSDLLKMLFVLPAAILFYCVPKSERKSEPDPTSYLQVKFYMLQMLVTLTLHCISTWLTVFLAAFRYVFLSCRTLSAYVSSIDRAFVGVSIVVLLSTTLCIPSYVEHQIVSTYINQTDPSTNLTHAIVSYEFQQTAFSKLLSLRDKVFVLHSVIFKLIPCILLLLFSFLLVQQLRDALKKSEILHRHSSAGTTGTTNSTRARAGRREKENRRTTLMLVIVCVLFLVTELPQGAILLMSFLSKKHAKYYFHIYQQLGDTFDILALINNSVNFILYCLMSRAFRETFQQTFFDCHEINRRQSSISFAQVTVGKQRPRHLTPSVAYEIVSTFKCSDDYRTSLTPIMKTLTDNPKKKRTIKPPKFFHRSNSIGS